MEEAIQDSEIKEAAPQENQIQTPQEEPQAPPPEDRQERNWRAARQRIAELERTAQEKDDLLKKALEFQKQAQAAPEEPEPDADDYVNYGSVKRVASKTIEPLHKEIEQLKQQLARQHQRELVANLRAKHPDFDDVVNPETIALFEEKEPELAQAIGEMKDPYKIGIHSYKYIKALNLQAEVPGRRHQKEAEKKLEKNAKSIQSPQALDKRPMAQAFQMTEAEKSNLYKEMQQYASLADSVPPMA